MAEWSYFPPRARKYKTKSRKILFPAECADRKYDYADLVLCATCV